eukprot:s1483_g16.t1
MVLELTALSLACNSAPVLSAEMDPVTGRPALAVSLDLKVRMDVVALVEILASIAKSQVEGGEEEEQTAEAGQEEEGREETEAADDAALLTGKPRIRAEETAPMPFAVFLFFLKFFFEAGRGLCFDDDNEVLERPGTAICLEREARFLYGHEVPKVSQPRVSMTWRWLHPRFQQEVDEVREWLGG